MVPKIQIYQVLQKQELLARPVMKYDVGQLPNSIIMCFENLDFLCIESFPKIVLFH
jgi:hypothetical protein